MKEKTPYQRKLAHPDWQMKRLELFKARGLKCEDCYSKDKELHIHHVYYLPNTKPQDYPDNAYKVLCYECHLQEEEQLKYLESTIIGRLRKCLGNAWCIDYLLKGIEKYSENFTEDGNPIFYLGDNISDYNSLSKEEQKEVDLLVFDLVNKKIEEYKKNKEQPTNGSKDKEGT